MVRWPGRELAVGAAAAVPRFPTSFVALWVAWAPLACLVDCAGVAGGGRERAVRVFQMFFGGRDGFWCAAGGVGLESSAGLARVRVPLFV